ncbi:MAG: TonB-linked SusC/RagA family outer membrane protein [Limisphaerales bacterium]
MANRINLSQIDFNKKKLNMILSNSTEFRQFSKIVKGVLVFLFLSVALGMNGQRSVSGTVSLKNDGSSLIGVNILVKGTTTGTITDIDGSYSLIIPTNEDILVFSYLGMVTQEVVIGSRTNIDVVMINDAQTLDEFIVTGYGGQKKVNLSGAVDNLGTEQLESRPISNLAQGLQGVSPNLNIDFNSGEPGQAAKINIRGFTSLNGGSPLILIDGVPSDAIELNRIAPRDVASISVLKDASSAAIYGARAAFGVIIITTKTGNVEGIQVSYSNNVSTGSPTVIGDKITDPYIYLRLKETSTDNTPWDNFNFSDERYLWAKERSEGTSSEAARINPNDPSRWEYMGNQDWSEHFLTNTVSQEHHLAINGKSQSTQYYLSGSFNKNKGALKVADDFFDRYTLRGKVNFDISDNFSIGNNTYLTNTQRRNPSYFNIQTLYNFEPTDHNINPDGTWANTAVGEESAQLSDGGVSKDRYNSYQTTFSAELRLIKDVFKINADYTARRGNSNFSQDFRRYAIGFGPESIIENGTNTAYRSSTNETYNVANIYGTYTNTFASKHQVTAIAGYNQEYSRSEWFSAYRNGVISSSLPTIALATGEAQVNEQILDWAVRGAFYRLNYIFADKYIVELNGRYDGSSKFPKENRFGFFPSASVAWRMDRESFFNSNLINQFKLRASYGSLGNQSVGEYGYIPNLFATSGNYIIDGKLPQRIIAPPLVSANYGWEDVSSLNLGLDIGLLEDKITFNLDYYIRDTKGMLTKGRDLPDVLGASEPAENAADLRTKGWEAGVNFRHTFAVGGKPLSFNTRLVLSDSRTHITKFDNPNGNLNQFYEGMELGEIWGLTSDGLFQNQAEIDALDQTELIPWGALSIVPGWPKFVDTDGNGMIQKGLTTSDTKDLSVIGNISSRLRFGMNFGFDWNNFDLDVFVQGVAKRDYYPQDYLYWGFYQQPYAGGYSHLTDFYRPEADSDVRRAIHSESYLEAGLADANIDAEFPILQAWLADRNLGERVDQSRGLAIPQTNYLLNGAYIRLKNITLGYRLPQALADKMHIHGLRIFVSGDNIGELSGVSDYYDPEAITDVDDKLDPSVSTARGTGSGYAYPFQRRYSVGINLDF